MLKKVVIFASIAGFTMLMSGCATILDGKTQAINLTTSEPKTVYINGQEYSAPGVITLQKANKDAVLNIRECDKTILLTKSVSPSFFVNILSGGAFGSTTDYSTDAMWKYDQTNVNVDCN